MYDLRRPRTLRAHAYTYSNGIPPLKYVAYVLGVRRVNWVDAEDEHCRHLRVCQNLNTIPRRCAVHPACDRLDSARGPIAAFNSIDDHPRLLAVAYEMHLRNHSLKFLIE
jgi:hypothetical protein